MSNIWLKTMFDLLKTVLRRKVRKILNISQSKPPLPFDLLSYIDVEKLSLGKNGRKVYVHIGSPKTGSTSLQKTLHDCNDAVLKPQGFNYVRMRGEACHSLVQVLKHNREDYFVNRRHGLDNQDLEQMRQEHLAELENKICSSEQKKFILSSESFVEFIPAEIEQFGALLEAMFEEIVLIAYIRDVRDFMPSHYQQQMKSGLKVMCSGKSLLPTYNRIHNSIAAYQRSFPATEACFLRFGKGYLKNDNVIDDFSKRLGIEIPQKYHVRVNDSLSAEAISLLYVFYKFGPNLENVPATEAIMAKITNKLSNLQGRKLQFHPVLLDSVLGTKKRANFFSDAFFDMKVPEISTVSNISGIREFDDLEHVDTGTLSWLSQQLPDEQVEFHTKKDIALAVYRLADH